MGANFLVAVWALGHLRHRFRQRIVARRVECGASSAARFGFGMVPLLSLVLRPQAVVIVTVSHRAEADVEWFLTVPSGRLARVWQSPGTSLIPVLLHCGAESATCNPRWQSDLTHGECQQTYLCKEYCSSRAHWSPS